MRWLRSHADVAIALVVVIVTVGTNPIHGLAVALAAAASAPLIARRRYPFTVFVVTAVLAELYLVVQDERRPGVLILAAPLIALYTVAEASSRRRALTIGVTAMVAFALLHIAAKPSSLLGGDNLALAALGGLAVAAGDSARSRREYLVEVQTKAEADAARRITDERLRIARDLHDAVGHHLALINVQASVAAHVLDASPSSAREALGHVRQASRTALGDLRDTIGLLRQPGDQLPTEPTPGLSGLADLLASFRDAGLDIEPVVPTDSGRASVVADSGRASVVTDLGHVPVPIDLAAYRVIQEALTNVRKHAGPVRVRVTTVRRADTLHVVVDNSPGTRQSPEPGGHGLLGMRERVAALGGSLSAGVRPDGGYRVRATFPLDPTFTSADAAEPEHVADGTAAAPLTAGGTVAAPLTAGGTAAAPLTAGGTAAAPLTADGTVAAPLTAGRAVAAPVAAVGVGGAAFRADGVGGAAFRADGLGGAVLQTDGLEGVV